MRSGEALHGVACGCLPAAAAAPGSTGCPTSFPAPAALGAAFDVGLVRDVAGAIGREARALHADGGPGALWLFAPNLNPARDPRWGRGQEVSARYGEAFVAGLQGTNEFNLPSRR
jgi:beta-D-xylosidase 4